MKIHVPPLSAPGRIDIYRLDFPFPPGKYVFEGPNFFTVLGGLINLEMRPQCLGPIGYASTGKLLMVSVEKEMKQTGGMCPQLSPDPKFIVVHGEPNVNSYWAGIAGTLNSAAQMEQTFRQAIRLGK